MGTAICNAPPPPGGKDTPAFVGSATARGRSAGRSTTSAASPKRDLSHAKAAM
ncbi:hypothetical protein DPMN_017286 [Dreissena polymorpha]|uniref:Uncharacterized protein n=1 Tax=Dreissena polymorpha TaxID=45954 RepID=A0A9D4NH66_DREPO|nr:hypothetical protein DPMN_017286 [Dreissena polymorpha]